MWCTSKSKIASRKPPLCWHGVSMASPPWTSCSDRGTAPTSNAPSIPPRTVPISELPSRLVAGGFQIRSFQPEQLNLETAFMRLTKGSGLLKPTMLPMATPPSISADRRSRSILMSWTYSIPSLPVLDAHAGTCPRLPDVGDDALDATLDADLAVVVGGDGTMIQQARRLLDHTACRSCPSTAGDSASSPRSTPRVPRRRSGNAIFGGDSAHVVGTCCLNIDLLRASRRAIITGIAVAVQRLRRDCRRAVPHDQTRARHRRPGRSGTCPETD